MDQILALVANYGFPMVLCMYLLVRIEGKLEQLTASINELAKVLGNR